MRIIIDMQGAQTASRFRGIGRYTMALTREMARQRGTHEILLALNAAYADTIEPVRAAFADLLPFDALRVFEVPGPVGGHDAANDTRSKAAELMFEAFLSSLNPDVIFIPSLFEEFGGEAVTSVHTLHNTIPTAVTLHDLIPLVHSSVYLRDQAMERWYLNKLDQLRRADLLLSVSDASGREATQHLNVPASAVVTVANACDAAFCPISICDAQRAHLKNRYGIDRPFVISTGDTDPRKNLDGLFRAFAALSDDVRNAHLLVLTGQGVAAQKTHFLALAKQAGLREDGLIFTGYVPDQDLALLYNASTLFVFPSWHEGFGLPVLEAMSCGKAVIAADSSSLPEVVGRHDALFAPHDDGAMAAKIAEVLEHPEFRQELEQHGLAQAKNFSWEISAKRAWQALETLHRGHQTRQATPPLSSRPRLAFVAPLPPERTGIADYASELLPELARHYEITVISAQKEVSDAWVQANAPVRDVAWFLTHARKFHRVVYQFGNSPFHSHMFDLLAEIPGVVVLHDFYLSWPVWHRDKHGPALHGWAQSLLAGHGWDAVRRRLQANSWSELVATVTAYPCNLAVLQQALGIIVHSNFSRRLARQFYGEHGDADWALIPHMRQPARPLGKAIARKRLGLAETDFVVCSFGALDPTKLNHRLLDAWLESLHAKNVDCHLVYVGENHNGDYGQTLLKKISESLAKGRIVITGWVDVETYRTWLAAADAGVQLRCLSRGETSGTVLDCMNYGLPTIVNANGSMADLPTDAVAMLPDEFSDVELTAALDRLYQDADFAKALGTCAQETIYLNHNPRICAEQYCEAIESFYSRAKTSLAGLIEALPSLAPAISESAYPRIANTLARNFQAVPRRPQILVDISGLAQHDAKTGIQRVVRALLQQTIFSLPKHWSIEPVYATPDRPGYRYARKFMSRFLNIPDDWAEDTPVEAWQGDIFLGLDLQQYIVKAQYETLQNLKLRGISIYFVIYDLLPVLMPHAFPDHTENLHHQWLSIVTQFDGALCISRAVADELFGWLQNFGEKRERPFALHWFHLGADVDNSAPSAGMPVDAPKNLAALKARPTFLMVGTIEPRKGYLQTLHAFEALWAEGRDVNLVIVGREGWKSMPLSQRCDIPETVLALSNHAELGKRLLWLDGISDEYLGKIYSHANCLIASSYGEGFGLPLIEAARFGLSLLVRDIPVFREVTDAYTHFFADSRDPLVITRAVQEWLLCFEKGEHRHSGVMPYKTWQDSADQVLNFILRKTPPYIAWKPDGVRRYWGADPRLYTEVGKRIGKAIHTTGKAGMLFYGPYERFDAGRYQLAISGNAGHLTGEEWMDVVSTGGTREYAHVETSTIVNNPWQTIVDFELNQACADLEVRLFVHAESDIWIDSVEISAGCNECFE